MPSGPVLIRLRRLRRVGARGARGGRPAGPTPGGELAREAGFEAEPLVVAEVLSVPDTLVRVAGERDAQAIVVGASGRGGLGELLLGSTSRGVIKRATRPVVVVREFAAQD